MMKNDAHKKLNNDEVCDLLDALVQSLAIPPQGLGHLLYPPLPIIVISNVTIPVGCSDDDADMDDKEFDEDDWHDPDDWECDYLDTPHTCPHYEPLSEKADRCLFLCPGCGDCMRLHIAEDLE